MNLYEISTALKIVESEYGLMKKQAKLNEGTFKGQLNMAAFDIR